MVNGESFCMAAPVSEATEGFVDELRYRSAWTTYVAGNVLLLVGLAFVWIGLWMPKSPSKLQGKDELDPTQSSVLSADLDVAIDEDLARKAEPVTPLRACLRFLTVYILGAATVCIWHGCWYFIDFFFLPQYAIESWWASAVVGSTVCFVLLAGNSLLAPPAVFLLDGPSYAAPPIGITILTSYKSITTPVYKLKAADAKKDSWWISILDMSISYLFLPWPVVGFWRGFWYCMDEYLYAWGDHFELHLSILYSTLIGIGCLFLGSEDIFQHIPSAESVFGANHPLAAKVGNHVLLRLRTVILAIGCVNFWRAVWLTWDEFLGSTSIWSAAMSHVLGVLVLLFLGCLSCICAPPSTLGADAIAVPDCADEPLFFNVPIASEALYVLAIGRQADTGVSDETFSAQLTTQLEPMSSRSHSLHFYQQTSSQLELSARSESSLKFRLSKRNSQKRRNSQFFRNR